MIQELTRSILIEFSHQAKIGEVEVGRPGECATNSLVVTKGLMTPSHSRRPLKAAGGRR